VGTKLHSKGFFGYASMDLVCFPDYKNPDQKLFWALGLKCYLDNAAATTGYFDHFMDGKLN